MQFTGKGGTLSGQNYNVNDDWNRTDLQSYVPTIDYPSKSYKEEQVRSGEQPDNRRRRRLPHRGRAARGAMASGNYA
jgi:hypothetical protein